MFNAVLFEGQKTPVTKSFEEILECMNWLSSCEENCMVRIEKDGVNEVLNVKATPEGNLFSRYDGSCWQELSAEQLRAVFENPRRGYLLQTLGMIHAFQKKPELVHSLMPCPRCGKQSMDDHPVRNALSRHAMAYICNACGMDEAMRDYAQTVLPLEKWAFAEVAGKELC